MAARLTLKCPVRWTSMTACQSSGNMLWNILSRRMPAALNTMCSPPKVSRACCTICRQSSNFATEPKLATASPPAALISSAVACAGLVSPPSPAPPTPGSTTTILAPSLAISLATSAPTPRAAPVQIATRPSSMPIADALSRISFGPQLTRRPPALSIRPQTADPDLAPQLRVGVQEQLPDPVKIGDDGDAKAANVLGRWQQVRHHDSHHARRACRADAVVGILQRQA